MSKPPRRFLGVTKRVDELSYSVTQVEFDNPIYTGISWRHLADGLVPLYEEHDAREQAHIGMTEWYEMHPMERAFVVAKYRIKRFMEGHEKEAEAKAAEQQAKRR